MDKSSSGGVGVLGVLEVVFIVLKLCDLVDWSWPVVLLPLWIYIACLTAFVILEVVARILDR